MTGDDKVFIYGPIDAIAISPVSNKGAPVGKRLLSDEYKANLTFLDAAGVPVHSTKTASIDVG